MLVWQQRWMSKQTEHGMRGVLMMERQGTKGAERRAHSSSGMEAEQSPIASRKTWPVSWGLRDALEFTSEMGRAESTRERMQPVEGEKGSRTLGEL